MLGAVLWETGDDKLDVRDDIELMSGPGPGQVQVRIRATGLCHTDLTAMSGDLPAPVPAILGHEAAGEIVAVGDGVTQVTVGDHVIIALIPSCGRCALCLGGQPHLCENVNPFEVEIHHRIGDDELYAFANVGAFAEQIILPTASVVVVPDDVPFDVAAVIGCGVITGVGAAINAAHVEPGASVVVFGCGGVGMSIIQGARLAGAAEIVAVDPIADRLEAALNMGATHAVTPRDLTRLGNGIHGGRGFDYAFEAVGRGSTIRAAYDNARRGGSVIIVGAGSLDDMVEFSALELFYQEKKLLGSVYGSGNAHWDFDRILRLWRTGRLDLEAMISGHINITEINEGLAALRNGEGIRHIVEFS